MGVLGLFMLSELGIIGWLFATKLDPTKSKAYQDLKSVTTKKDREIKMLADDLKADEEELKLAYTPERMAYDKAGKIAADKFHAYIQTLDAAKPPLFMQEVFTAAIEEMKKDDSQVQATDRFVISETKGTGARRGTFKYLVFKYKGEEGKEESYALSIGDGLYSLVLQKYLEAKL